MRLIEEIKAGCEAATPGPWSVYQEMFVTYAQATTDGDFVCQGFNKFEEDFYNWDANAQFIANARQDVPDLVAEVGRLREQLIAVRKSVGPFFCMRYDEDGNETGESIYIDQGVHVLANAYRLDRERWAAAESELERLRALLGDPDA